MLHAMLHYVPPLRHWAPAALAALALLASGTARAEVILSVQDVTAEAGTTGNALEVLLTNTDDADLADVAAFSFRISVATTDVIFTAADITAATYLFDGISGFGPDIRLPGQGEGQVLDASDADDTLAGVSVGAGQTFSLGRVLYRVAAGSNPRVVSVALAAFPASSLSAPDFSEIPITSFVNGSITITTGQAVIPEPSTLILSGTAGVLALGLLRLRSRPEPRRSTAVDRR